MKQTFTRVVTCKCLRARCHGYGLFTGEWSDSNGGETAFSALNSSTRSIQSNQSSVRNQTCDADASRLLQWTVKQDQMLHSRRHFHCDLVQTCIKVVALGAPDNSPHEINKEMKSLVRDVVTVMESDMLWQRTVELMMQDTNQQTRSRTLKQQQLKLSNPFDWFVNFFVCVRNMVINNNNNNNNAGCSYFNTLNPDFTSSQNCCFNITEDALKVLVNG